MKKKTDRATGGKAKARIQAVGLGLMGNRCMQNDIESGSKRR